MIKTVVSGAVGRMGSRIIALMKESGTLALHGALESSACPRLGEDVGEIIGVGRLGVPVISDPAVALKGAEVVIDFSHATATPDVARAAASAGVPIVIGTTGFKPDEVKTLQGIVEGVPCVLASNMSVGVNLLLGVLQHVARVLGDGYDIEIIETHHRLKKDAPSGTAMTMARTIAEALGRDLGKVGVYGREGMVGERTATEIGIHTVRGGDVVGDHTVLFAGLGERIEITHKASSRDTFARGALKAAQWVAGRQPGFYSMRDVLGV